MVLSILARLLLPHEDICKTNLFASGGIKMQRWCTPVCCAIEFWPFIEMI